MFYIVMQFVDTTTSTSTTTTTSKGTVIPFEEIFKINHYLEGGSSKNDHDCDIKLKVF